MNESETVAGWWYWPLLWLVLVGGLVPAGYFLSTWRPSKLLRPGVRELDAGGWVWAIFLLYLSSAARAVVGHPTPTLAPALIGLAIGVMVDALLVLRAMHWRRLRHSTELPQRRSTDTPPL